MGKFLRDAPAERTVTARMILWFLLVLLFQETVQSHGKSINITAILSKHPDLKNFSNSLIATNLTTEINSRKSITVCALDNNQMDKLSNLHKKALKNVLSLHVLLDFFSFEKFHELSKSTTLSATLFQTTGLAEGNSGFVNITVLKNSSVAFAPENKAGKFTSLLVKNITEISSSISVIQISHPLSWKEEEAPSPSPNPRVQNLTYLMSKARCGAFAKTLYSNIDASKAFSVDQDKGLTVFCPFDGVFGKFLATFNNLPKMKQKVLLENHGLRVFKANLTKLKKKENESTLASGVGGMNFKLTLQVKNRTVEVSTTKVTAKITNTVADKDLLAIYVINKVLEPMYPENVPSPAPAPEPVAEAPKKAKSRRKKALAPAPTISPSPGEDGFPADQTADDNAAVSVNGEALSVGFFVGLTLFLFS